MIETCLDLAAVHTGLRVPDKPRLLTELARLVANGTTLPPTEIEAALLAREALGSTGLGGGIALPHARLARINQPLGLFASLRTPIAFDAVDDEPVDLIFLLLLPAGSTGAHLGALAAASRKLRDGAVATRLRRAKGALEAFALLVN